MSDKITILRSEAKISMENLVSKALLQDATSNYKRHLFLSGYRYIGVAFGFIALSSFIYKIPEAESIRNSFTNGMSNIFLYGTRSIRERHDPLVYEKDMMYRRQESQLFS
jgi:hypothetical protein